MLLIVLLCCLINRFALAHLHGKCRRAVVLEYFGEEVIKNEGDGDLCCDVCASLSSQPMVNFLPEIQVIVRVVEELPNLGETKVIFCNLCAMNI